MAERRSKEVRKWIFSVVGLLGEIDFKSVLLACIISAILAFLMLFQLTPFKWDFTSLETKVAGMQGTLTSNQQDIYNLTATVAYQSDMYSLDSTVADIDGRLINLEDTVDALNSGLEYTLREDGNNYTLTVISPTSGSYLARFILLRDNPNIWSLSGSPTTYDGALLAFYSDLDTNWNWDNFPFSPVLVWDGDKYGISEIRFLTEPFSLDTGLEYTLDISIGDLDEALGYFNNYDLVYVEVFSVVAP